MKKHVESEILDSAWYVYLNDHFHGPFSELELYAWTRNQNEYNKSYFWKYGMESWALLNETDLISKFTLHKMEFEELIKTQDTPILWKNWSPIEADKKLDASMHKMDWHIDGIAKPLGLREDRGIKEETRQELKAHSEVNFKTKTKVTHLALICTVSILVVATLLFIMESYWSRLVRPLGVSESDYSQLTRALEKSELEVGPRFAVAIANAEIENPQIYITSNISDQGSFKIEVAGIASKMVGSFYFNQSIELEKKRSLIEVPSLAQESGKIPKGFYQIKVLYKKNIILDQIHFMGGRNDNTYEKELLQYHQSLFKQLQLEILELKQLLLALEGQIAFFNSEFEIPPLLSHSQTNFKQNEQFKFNEASWIKFQSQIMEYSLNIKNMKQDQGMNYILLPYFQLQTEVGERLINLHQALRQLSIQNKSNVNKDLSLGLEIEKIKGLLAKVREQVLNIELRASTLNKIPWELID